MQSFQLTGSLITTGNAKTIKQDLIRVVLLYDRQTNGALPAIGDVFLDVDNQGTGTTTSRSGLNMNNRDRFKVIRDWKLPLMPVAVDANGLATTPVATDYNLYNKFCVFVKLKGMVAQFKADTAVPVIGDIASGSLLLVTLGEQAAGNEQFSLQFNCRLRFTDG